MLVGIMSDLLDILQASSRSDDKSKKFSRNALYILSVTGGSAVALTLAALPFISPAFRKICLPYVPASEQQVVNVLHALKGRSGTLVDLGSGDGRIVRAAASVGFKAVGVELNIWLVLYSRLLTTINRKMYQNVKFYRQNLWKFNLKSYSNVVVFGTEEMMPKVEEKCLKEMKNDSTIVACRFPLPNVKPDRIIGEGIDTVWRYSMKTRT